MIYLDHHATTPLDPRVLEAMLPFLTEHFGNAGSIDHAMGRRAAQAVEAARETIAHAIGATPKEIVFTSGATESNNLALRGVCESRMLQRRAVGGGNPGRLVSVATEHKAILDPLQRLRRRGWEVALLPVQSATSEQTGRIDFDQLEDSLDETTVLASVMLANNEIGVLQPIAQIGELCRRRGVLLHCDAAQAVGKISVDVNELNVDLMSLSAHKIYGPKGVGALYVRRHGPRVRLASQIDGGGQEGRLRSGTLNVPGIVGFAKAMELCAEESPGEARRLSRLRNTLFEKLTAALPDVQLHGPCLESSALRLPGNLNCGFPQVDGDALMSALTNIAVSSGAACTTADPEPSHVLRALQVDNSLSRASLRFGLGRSTTGEDIDRAADEVITVVKRLRRTSTP